MRLVTKERVVRQAYSTRGEHGVGLPSAGKIFLL